jgi:transglutaminase superfamily protein
VPTAPTRSPVESPVRRLLVRGPIATLRLPLPELLTTLHAAVVIVVVELLVRWVTLPRLSRLLGVRLNLAPAPAGAERLRVKDLPPRAARQVRCTRRVADAWPFSQGPCLRRSLVAGHLLRALDPALRLGVAGSGDQFYAHAWLEIHDRPLEAVAGFSRFQREPIEHA